MSSNITQLYIKIRINYSLYIDTLTVSSIKENLVKLNDSELIIFLSQSYNVRLAWIMMMNIGHIGLIGHSLTLINVDWS